MDALIIKKKRKREVCMKTSLFCSVINREEDKVALSKERREIETKGNETWEANLALCIVLNINRPNFSYAPFKI